MAKIAEEDEKEAKARAEKQMERLGSPSQVARGNLCGEEFVLFGMKLVSVAAAVAKTRSRVMLQKFMLEQNLGCSLLILKVMLLSAEYSSRHQKLNSSCTCTHTHTDTFS